MSLPQSGSRTPGQPEQIGRYKVLDTLWQSGLSRVYRVSWNDAGTPRLGALKTCLGIALADQETRERFAREVTITIGLRHPNVCEVWDWGYWEAGTPYLVMELLEAVPLLTAMAPPEALPMPLACSVMRQTLDGLAAIHEHGIVHRDLNPGNLVYTSNSAVKILDFGLSRRHGARPLTPSGVSIGAAPYISPEQLFNSKHVDGRADLFSAGAVFYQMLCGHVPFEGSTLAELLSRVSTGEITPLTRWRPDLPGHLVVFVHQLLAPDREHRPGSARAALEACPAL
ncbi:MAG: serine/threonine protein kinase [Candidatus Xenobia bacterium]